MSHDQRVSGCIFRHVAATTFSRSNMQLRRIYVRYYPPGLRLEYTSSTGQLQRKTIDLLHLKAESNLQVVISQLLEKEPLLTKVLVPKLKELLHRLVDKQLHGDTTARDPWRCHAALRPHQLPMCNMAWTKNAKLLATGSYDKTIRLLRPLEKKPQQQLQDDQYKSNTLTGHEGVVYCLAFNQPHATKLLSGSFDKTCRVWDVRSRASQGVYASHEGEVVAVAFTPTGDRFGSCSMDCTSILWDIETEQELHALVGHTAEVSCLAFDSSSRFVATGSCDSTVRLWDINHGACFRSLDGHDGEISNVVFDYQSHLVASSSSDSTCKVWDVRTGKCLFDIRDHKGEVMDVTFNSTGALFATSGSDGKAFVYDSLTGTRRCVLQGHTKAISKVSFNMQSSHVLTASADTTARMWHSYSGECLQVLRGHEEEVHSCGFSYDGRAALTASFDNSVRVWQREND